MQKSQFPLCCILIALSLDSCKSFFVNSRDLIKFFSFTPDAPVRTPYRGYYRQKSKRVKNPRPHSYAADDDAENIDGDLYHSPEFEDRDTNEEERNPSSPHYRRKIKSQSLSSYKKCQHHDKAPRPQQYEDEDPAGEDFNYEENREKYVYRTHSNKQKKSKPLAAVKKLQKNPSSHHQEAPNFEDVLHATENENEKYGNLNYNKDYIRGVLVTVPKIQHEGNLDNVEDYFQTSKKSNKFYDGLFSAGGDYNPEGSSFYTTLY